jgi:CBS domain-containing protein
MDGGRVLRALLASRFGYVRATEIAAAIGQFVAFALGFIGLMVNPILIFIAIFVYLAATSEAHMVALRAASRGVPVSYAMMKQFATLPPQAHLDEAVQTLLQTGQGEFPVVDGTGKPVGVLGRGDLIRAIKTLGPDARVADAMTVEMPTISHRVTLEQAFKLLQQTSAPAVGVTDAAGKLVGLVTGETIAKMMMLQDVLPKGRADRPLEPAAF